MGLYEPFFLWRKWKRSSFDSVAATILTGTETRPKEIVPLQIDRGMLLPFPPGTAAKTVGFREVRPRGIYGLQAANNRRSRASPQAGGPTLGAGFTRPEPYSGPGKSLWILGIVGRRSVCSSENAEGAESRSSPAFQLVARDPVEPLEGFPERFADQPGRLVVVVL